MKQFKRTLAMVLSVAMMLQIGATTAIAADTAMPVDSGAYVSYSNGKENYVSIDTKEANAKSEWFGVSVNDNLAFELKTGTAPTIKAVLKDVGENKTETDTALADTLSVAPMNGANANGCGTRFLVNSGKTPPAGIYYVTLEISMIERGAGSNAPVVYGQANVELHVNSGDPSYVKGNEIRFDMEFNGKAQTLTSQPVQIANPSSTNLSGVQGSFYADENCTQELSYLSVTDATSNSFKVKAEPVDGILTIPYQVYFKMQTKARAVFTPVAMTIGVYATNPDSVYELVYEKNLDASSAENSYTDVVVKDTRGATASVSRVTLLENTFDNKDAMEVSQHRISAFKKATGKFEAEFIGPIQSDDYLIEKAVLVYKDRPISSTGKSISNTPPATVEPGAKIDLNNLNTYTVPMKAYGYDVNGNAVTPTAIKLASGTNMFELVAGSVKANEAEKCLEFSVQLENKNATIMGMTYNLNFEVTVDPSVAEQAVGEVELYTEQPEFYLSEAGSSTSLNDKSVSMPLGSTKKFDLHVKGHKTNESVFNQIGVGVGGDNGELHNQSFSIVRGAVLFVPASGEMVETITVRYNTPVEQGVGDIYLTAFGEFALPAITNPDVLLKLKAGLSDSIYSTVQILPTAAPTPTPTPGGGGSGSGGGGGSSIFKPSASQTTPGASLTANAAAKAVQDAIAAGNTSVTIKNVSTLTPDALKSITDTAKGANLKVSFDTVADRAVTSRITVNPADLAKVMTENLPLSVSHDQKNASVKAVLNLFEKHFDNKIVAVTFEQKTPLGVNAEFCAKLDLSGLNTKTLQFYSYNPVTNAYTLIANANFWVDKNGYAHITAPLGGSVIITDKPLTKK